MEYGNPNPYSKDENGVTPLHAACAKLDWESFDELVKIGGDPMIPDQDGNTFLHLLSMGVIRDKEYDFAKLALQSFNLKLTRNRDGKTPLNILRSLQSNPNLIRGQPNYKGKLQNILEDLYNKDVTFMDDESNNLFH